MPSNPVDIVLEEVALDVVDESVHVDVFQGGPSGLNGTDGKSINWRGTWTDTDSYLANDAVHYDGQMFVANTSVSVDEQPPGFNSRWDLAASKGAAGSEGSDGPAGPAGSPLVWAGAYSSDVTYEELDCVSFENSTYVANTSIAVSELDPPDNPHWDLVALAGAAGADGEDGVDGLDGTSFQWIGDWDSELSWSTGDVCQFEGDLYIVLSSFGSGIAVDPDANPAMEVFLPRGSKGDPGTNGTDGEDGLDITWLGAWDSSPAYAVNDAVSYQGSSYICNTPISSGTITTPDASGSWDLMASKGDQGDPGTNGIDGTNGEDGTDGTNGTNGTNGTDGLDITWLGAWDSSPAYAVNDAVSYLGSSYICNTPISSGTLTTPNASGSWDLMASKGDQGADGDDAIVDDSIFISEKSSAEADVAGEGQVWVEDATPNRLRFTDDAGNDHIAGGRVGFSVQKSTTTLVASTWTKVSFDTELDDTDNAHSGSTFTVPEDGFYVVTGVATLQTLTNGKNFVVAVRKNGTLASLLGRGQAGATATTGFGGADVMQLSAGDTLELWCHQNDTLNRALKGDAGNESYNRFAAYKIG